ncbi:phage baseplate protein [Psychrobacter fulvigenes]|uniref:phage baseplate protein n=1 Tax=Psychrobacter fulvigenes TaxID=533323 RepID=UPI00191A072E|nr:hypothetical protein [Psychrobacter fulvigenes]
MHRIDSATARANVNGEGKTGFHDNGDLPNQDATYFTPDWANALQEEVAGVIEGLGLTLDKSDNGQLLKALVQQFGEKKMLTDAIKEYKDLIKTERQRIDELELRTYEDTQIGELFWTTEHFLTPEAVTTYKGYGTWERALQGRVAVGFSDNPEDHIDFRTHGKEYGEREHTLTIDEMPKHVHTKTDYDTPDINGDRTGPTMHYGEAGKGVNQGPHSTGEAGGSKSHNNMQPSTTLDCWKRTA